MNEMNGVIKYDIYLKVNELAKLAGVSKGTIYKAIKNSNREIVSEGGIITYISLYRWCIYTFGVDYASKKYGELFSKWQKEPNPDRHGQAHRQKTVETAETEDTTDDTEQ